ncbi:MAG TPA: AMP-binding protein [Acidimicrobiales bacterium]|nr:AMP-binding protein [Acidimicrobiales bacterium]
MNLGAVVERHPADARALFEGGSWHTWGQLRARAGAQARSITAMGVGPGDRVAIAFGTSVDFVVAYLGVLACGGVAVPLNPNSPAAELAGELRAVGAGLLLAGGAAAGAASELAEQAGGTRVVVPEALAGSPSEGPGADSEPGTDSEPGPDTEPGTVAATGTDADPERYEVADRADDDVAVLLFTSGTAGAPRPAMLTHGNLLANLRQMLSVPGIVGSDDVALAAVPLFHVFGLNVALGLVLETGASLVLEERFDAAESLELVRDLGVTALLGVPAMFSAWADAPGVEPSALAGVRHAIAGAAALEPEVAERFEHRFGVPVWQGYGLTEASPAVSTSLGTGRNRAGSVGHPLPGVELRIVDEGGEQVLDGDPGEIWVRGPNVFAGYWGDEPSTAEVLTPDGWLRTGDVGVVGPDGDLYVVDRKKDLVIVSGFNVYPGEVEKVVAEVPGVSAAVVVGLPDALTGESVEAVVVRQPGAAVTEQQVRDQCASRLARYKCPSSVRFVDELPTGLAGKALRRAVRQQVT